MQPEFHINPLARFLSIGHIRPAPISRERESRFKKTSDSAELRSTLAHMPRKRLTLADLVAAGTFDPRNHRHRRALDESEPLDDPELEQYRRFVLSCRRVSDRAMGASALREFARLVAEERVLSVGEPDSAQPHVVDGERV